MTAAFQPLPSRDGDDADADRRAWLASLDTGILGPLPAPAPAPVPAAEPSVHAADMPTVTLISAVVQASVVHWNRKWAEDHAREARRLRAEVSGMEINLDDLRATLRRYVARRDVLLGYSHRSDDEQRELGRLDDAIVRQDATIADVRACMIATRQVAREREAAAQMLLASVAPSANSNGQGMA